MRQPPPFWQVTQGKNGVEPMPAFEYDKRAEYARVDSEVGFLLVKLPLELALERARGLRGPGSS